MLRGPMGRVLGILHRQYGVPPGSKKLVVVQTDDRYTRTYSASGIIFLASKLFDSSPVPEDNYSARLLTMVGAKTVGLKSSTMPGWPGARRMERVTYREANEGGHAGRSANEKNRNGR